MGGNCIVTVKYKTLVPSLVSYNFCKAFGPAPFAFVVCDEGYVFLAIGVAKGSMENLLMPCCKQLSCWGSVYWLFSLWEPGLAAELLFTVSCYKLLFLFLSWPFQLLPSPCMCNLPLLVWMHNIILNQIFKMVSKIIKVCWFHIVLMKKTSTLHPFFLNVLNIT